MKLIGIDPRKQLPAPDVKVLVKVRSVVVFGGWYLFLGYMCSYKDSVRWFEANDDENDPYMHKIDDVICWCPLPEIEDPT